MHRISQFPATVALLVVGLWLAPIFGSAGSHLACAASAGDSAREPALAIGEPFPELWLPALSDGAPTSTKKWRGQKVILHVFASW